MRGWRCFDTRRPAGIYARIANQSAPVCLDSSALPPSSSSVSLPLSIRSSWNVAWSRTTSRVLSARLSFFFSFSLIPLYLCGSTLVSSRLLKNLNLYPNESCEVVVSPPLEKKKKRGKEKKEEIFNCLCLLLAGTILGEPGPRKDAKRCSQMHPIQNARVIVYLPSPFWLSNREE